MNILNINSYFLSSSVHETLLNSLKENEKFSIKTFIPTSNNYEIRPECMNIMDDDIIVKECFKKSDRFLFRYKNYKIYNEVFNTYDLTKFDVVHAHSLFTNGLIAMKIKKRFGIPYIVAVRDTDINVFFKYMYHLRTVGVDILLNAYKIIFLSKPYYHELKEKYINKRYHSIIEAKSVIIPNPLDSFWFNNIYDKKKNKEKPNKLLYVGNIEKRKNLLMLAEAVKNLNAREYKIELTIVGTSKDINIEKKLMSYPFITYIPRLNKEDLIEIYRNNDIFIMVSIRESFGLVYAEAMTQGLPVIYTKNQGFDGNFDNGEVGYSVDCKSLESIEKGISDAILNYNDIKRNVVTKSEVFKKEVIAEEYIRIFNELDL